MIQCDFSLFFFLSWSNTRNVITISAPVKFCGFTKGHVVMAPSSPWLFRTFLCPSCNCPRHTLPPPSPQPRGAPRHSALRLWVWLLQGPHVGGVAQFLSSRDWLISLGPVPSGFVHVVLCVRSFLRVDDVPLRVQTLRHWVFHPRGPQPLGCGPVPVRGLSRTGPQSRR